MSGLILEVPPAVEPVSVADAKAHSVIEHTEDDAMIAEQVCAARQWLETYTHRSLITRTYILELEAWLPEIELPRPPLITVDTITYWDKDNAQQTLDPAKYEVSKASMFGRVRPVSGETWPEVSQRYDAIQIKFQAGYGDTAASVPEDLIHAIKLLFGDLYEHRERTVVGASVNTMNTIGYLAHPHRALTL